MARLAVLAPTSVMVALLSTNVWSILAAMPTVNVPLLLGDRMGILELFEVT